MRIILLVVILFASFGTEVDAAESKILVCRAVANHTWGNDPYTIKSTYRLFLERTRGEFLGTVGDEGRRPSHYVNRVSGVIKGTLEIVNKLGGSTRREEHSLSGYITQFPTDVMSFVGVVYTPISKYPRSLRADLWGGNHFSVFDTSEGFGDEIGSLARGHCE